MLTAEIIRANSVLSALTDDQINAIVTMSGNDENQVIAKKTGDIYGGLDNDILAASGMEKNGTEKTYDYAKRVISEFRTKSESVNTQLAELQAEKTRLEGVIASGGGNDETKRQLEQSKADLAAVTKSFTELQASFTQKEKEYADSIFGLKVDGEMRNAAVGIAFRKDLPQSVTDILMRQAVDKVRGMKPEFVDDGNGGKVLVFKGEGGEIMRNKENQLNPFTASELLRRELETLGVIDKGVQGAGTGSQVTVTPPAGGTVVPVDLSMAKNQMEAQEIIAQGLMKRGIVNGSEEFQTELTKLWTENGIDKLPLK